MAPICLTASRRNYGLGAEDGSSMTLFGWRFTPTLIAVLYAQIVLMLFEDVERTEPFAQLAKPSHCSTSALTTVLQAPELGGDQSGWFLKQEERRQQKLDPYLLLLSPPYRIPAVSKKVEFTRMTPQAQISLYPQRDTYFRTIGYLLQSVSTSAWISDSYVVLPFWPKSQSASLGPILSTKAQTWNAETLTPALAMLRASYQVQALLFSGSIFAKFGGHSWSNLSTFISGQTYNASSALARMNFSQECRQDAEIILLSTPWLDPYELEDDPNFDFYSFSPNFTIRSELCASDIYMARMPVTATTLQATYKITFRRRVTSQNTNSGSERTFRSSTTSVFVSRCTMVRLYTKELWGLSAVLAALYESNNTAMINEADVPEQARRIRQRFFGELLQSSLVHASNAEDDWGLVTSR
ncbi:hypothetical protein K469DRAFT_681918 [Zopfia rhizophila CBS 207.26]|uniref:Uncharacterized protein n=1 Tax=Zopfia rhizophila CBS 207.26 TaxID=1314779 RepID=A0A6A6EXZ3_9PEZI|nr:hypothetical protein K469DRAFT_681918 [Zopfia rhizophila CBS 207.26]